MSAVASIDPREVAPTANAPASALQPAAQLPTGRKVLALGIMCLGFFIAYLDIQIVAASIQEVGGGLSFGRNSVQIT